jgi:hypothetical protein
LNADGLPLATASVNPDYLLKDGTVAIKDYSKNACILVALEAAGVVEQTGETIPIVYAEAHICCLLVN